MEIITSKLNENVKYLKGLNDKKNRKKFNSYYLEGIKVIDEAITLHMNGAINLEFIAYSYDILSNLNGGTSLLEKINQLKLKENNIKFLEVTKEIMNYITDTITSQGALVTVKIKTEDGASLIKNLVELNQSIVILDGVQDPGNIGTIIRTCKAFGIKDIVCLNTTADVYSPKVVRSTMGTILTMNILYINKEAETQFFKILKNNKIEILGTALENSKNITEFKFEKIKKYAFVLGNEANGMDQSTKNNCDYLLKIPISNEVESLNVSVANAIVLYEYFKKLN